jgi:two-component system chemotaxis sensor kinase CheA
MQILEPIVRAVGQLSFRNKLRATAVVFGIPLLIAAGLLLFALNARVFELKQERDALAVQVPALTLAANLHQLLAGSLATQEGAEQIDALVRAKRASSQAIVKDLQEAFAGRKLLLEGVADKDRLLGNWDVLSQQIGEGDTATIEKLLVGLRGEMEKLNEDTGLLIDGEASSSRLLDIMTTHLPGLVETTGRAAQIGSVVLVKKSVRGSRRTDLTLQRGNFDALVQWSMDSLQKVSRDHPDLAPSLSDAGSRLNSAYLASRHDPRGLHRTDGEGL